MATRSDAGPGWMLKALILLTGMPLSLGYAVVVPILARMSAALAHGETGEYLVKMVFGVLGPALVVGGALGGYLADKLDRRLLLTISALAFAAAGAAPFVLDSLPLILVSRVVMGMASVTIALIGSAMVADLFEEGQRPGWLGAVAAVQMVGSVLSLPVAGALGEAGWRWAFLIYLVGVPIAVLAWLAAPRGPSAQAGTQAGGATPAAAGTAGARSALPLPVGLLLLGLVIGAMMTIPGAYMPFRLGQLGLQNTSVIGVLLMLNALTGAAAAAVYGAMRKRLSARALFCCGYAAMAAGLGVLAATSNVVIATVGLLIMGLALGWLTPNLTAVVVAAVDETRRGRALGAVNAAAAIAPAVGLTALEPVARRIGADGVLLLTAALAAVMLAGTLAKELAAGKGARAGASPSAT